MILIKNVRLINVSLQNKFTVEGKKRWTMVVDTNSLLNKESMKSLQLLEGLQGTHLIVPRIGNEFKKFHTLFFLLDLFLLIKDCSSD